MAKRRHTAEQIIGKLREAEVDLAKGMPLAGVCRKLEIHEQTYYRWRKEFGGLRVDQAKAKGGRECLGIGGLTSKAWTYRDGTYATRTFERRI